MKDASSHNARTIYGVVKSFATSITSVAGIQNATWPYVTVPHFDILAALSLNTSGADFLAIAPFVTKENESKWEAYSQQNQGWLAEGLADNGFPVQSIPPLIHGATANGCDTEQDGEFLPLWQMSPIQGNVSGFNFNLLSEQAYHQVFQYIIDTKEPALSQVVNVMTLFHHDDYDNAPVSLMLEPIFSDFNNTNVVGILTAGIQWDTFFMNLLRKSARGVVIVVKTTCGDVFTYEVTGIESHFMGYGDLHDSQYNGHVYETDFEPFYWHTAVDNNSTVDCHHRLYIYPSDELHQAYETNRPAILTVAVVMIFVVTTTAFMTYDCLVQRRQEKVMDSAIKSNAIVSSLFPKEVRDRLFVNSEKRKMKKAMKDKAAKSRGGLLPSLTEAPKFRLNTFLHEGDGEKRAKLGDDEQEAMPIADLFPNATVMFGDIAGFTAWSSVREPSQVFLLLETVYKAFDTIAKRRHVFKVRIFCAES